MPFQPKQAAQAAPVVQPKPTVEDPFADLLAGPQHKQAEEKPAVVEQK